VTQPEQVPEVVVPEIVVPNVGGALLPFPFLESGRIIDLSFLLGGTTTPPVAPKTADTPVKHQNDDGNWTREPCLQLSLFLPPRLTFSRSAFRCVSGQYSFE
jgi:hypothetical protein